MTKNNKKYKILSHFSMRKWYNSCEMKMITGSGQWIGGGQKEFARHRAERTAEMISEKEKKNIQQFYNAVLSLENEEECRRFFDDVATIKEVLDLSARLEVARLLSKGEVFSVISKETGASSATISRVNKCITYGEGGYVTVLARLKEKE